MVLWRCLVMRGFEVWALQVLSLTGLESSLGRSSGDEVVVGIVFVVEPKVSNTWRVGGLKQ